MNDKVKYKSFKKYPVSEKSVYLIKKFNLMKKYVDNRCCQTARTENLNYLEFNEISSKIENE